MQNVSTSAGDADLACWDALRRGDRRGALTILMSTYGHRIYAFCRAMLRPHGADVVDDVHQVVFAQAYQSLAALKEAPAFKPWLFSIAKNRCLDELKRRRRWTTRFTLVEESPEPDPHLSARTADPEDRLQQRQEVAILERCVEQLAPAVRTAVLLRYLEDMAYDEMARISREAAGTLQKRVVRAIVVLRECLERRSGANR